MNYFWFAFNQVAYLSYLEITGIILGIIALCLMFKLEGAMLKQFNILLCIILAFFICANRTEYPNIHGDGEDGYVSVRLQDNFNLGMITNYPAQHGRMTTYLHWVADNTLPQINYKYHKSWISQPEVIDHRNKSFIFMILLVGIVFALIAGIIAFFVKNDHQKIVTGLILLMGYSSFMLNTMGHFDSYAIAIAGGMFWLSSVWAYFRYGATTRLWFMVMMAAGVAMFAHPGNFFYVIGTLLLLRSKIAYAFSGLILCVATYGHLDVTTIGTNTNYVMEQIPFWYGLMRDIHCRGMCILQQILPSIVLGLLCIRGLKLHRQKVGLIMAVMVFLSCFTFSFSYGMIDEFAYGVFGFAAFSGILMACDYDLLMKRAFYAGLLSFALFVASARVYSDERIIQREYDCLRYEVCNTIREISPYVSMGLRHPIDTPELEQHRLDIFWEGFNNPVQLYDSAKSRQLSLYYYTAWGLEFGNLEAGIRGLRIYENNNMLSSMLPVFLNPNSCFVWRHGSNMVNNVKKMLNVKEKNNE